jgi:hypothetical protein
MQHQGKTVSQGGIQVNGEKPVLFRFRRAAAFIKKIKTRFPNRREFPGRRVFGKGLKGIFDFAGFGEAQLGVNGETKKERRGLVAFRGGGQFPVKGEFRPVPGAQGGGYAKTAADIFGVRFRFDQVF